MLSLRKSLSELDELNNLFRTSLECYLAALRSMEQNAVEVTPEKVDEHRKALRRIRKAAQAEADAGVLPRSRVELDAELQRYGRWARNAIRQREKDIREILAMLAEAASAMTERSERHATQFRGLASDLESVSVLDNLSLIRRRLADNVGRLKSCVDTMRQDNQASVEQLRTELGMFRRRLEAAEVEAATDPLTGLANRREAERIINRRIEAGRSFCIMLFDLDGFKNINDCQGHRVGDEVLKSFARRLIGQFRADDVVCRWGGDEFLVILSSALPDAVGRASAVASTMCGLYTVACGKHKVNVHVAASVGMAQHEPGESAEDLFARADAFLYQSRGVTLAR